MKKNLLILAFAASSVWAQPPAGGPPPAHPVDAIKAYLGLTDAQIQGLEQLSQSEMAAGQSVRDQINAKMDTLQTQLKAGSSDATALGTLLVQIQTLRKQLTDAHANYQAQGILSLTADQKTKLATLATAAKLIPSIQQAGMLNLLDRPQPPVGAAGPGPGLSRRGPGAPPPPPVE